MAAALAGAYSLVILTRAPRRFACNGIRSGADLLRAILPAGICWQKCLPLAKTVGYTGSFRFDASKPDGMPRKMLDARAYKPLAGVLRFPIRKVAALPTHGF
jgi:hypothetical protein